ASAGSTKTDATSASVDKTSCQERPPSRLRKTFRLRARNQLGTPAARASTSALVLDGPKISVRASSAQLPPESLLVKIPVSVTAATASSPASTARALTLSVPIPRPDGIQDPPMSAVL